MYFLFLFTTGVIAQDDVELREVNLENYQYPYPVDQIRIQAQQEALSMAYMYIEANNPNGQTITLLHGKNFNGAYWKTTIDTLVAEGFNVLVPDQIGFGKSSKPENFQYSFQQLALNTKSLLDTLNISHSVIMGHSMGGMLATRFALMYPEFTTKLILLNPIGLEDWKLKVPYRPLDEWYKVELKKTYSSIKEYQKENYYDGEWNENFAEWAKLLAGWTLNEEYPLIAWNAALTYDMIFTQPVVYEFSELHTPTLLLIGTRDRTALGKDLVSKEVRETLGRYDLLGKSTAKKIPTARLIELENVGHLPHIEAFSDYISSLLEYLKN